MFSHSHCDTLLILIALMVLQLFCLSPLRDGFTNRQNTPTRKMADKSITTRKKIQMVSLVPHKDLS